MKKIKFTAYEGPMPKDWNKFRESDYENPECINDEQYGYLKEGGFTGVIALLERTREQGERGLKYAEKYGLEYYVRNEINWDENYDPELFEKNAYEYNAYKSYSSFAGMFICDEPNCEKYGALAAMKKGFDKFFDNKPYGFFVNLLPTYANDVTQLGADYPDYIARYAQTISTAFICFDHYPFMKNESGDYTRGDYLYNLKVVADACDKNGRDLWTFVQSSNFCKRKTEIDYAALSFQIMACLAYGSKNLIYYTYWTWPGYYAAEREKKFNPALVLSSGERTWKYFDAKRIHAFVNLFGEIIANSSRKRTYLLKGVPSIFKGADEETSEKIKSDGATLVGEFLTKDNKIAYLIVNAEDPYAKKYTQVSVGVKGDIYTLNGKYAVSEESEITLGAGEGVFVVENQNSQS